MTFIFVDRLSFYIFLGMVGDSVDVKKKKKKKIIAEIRTFILNETVLF
jgi:hypothetical protein